jgi:hypothetical protein
MDPPIVVGRPSLDSLLDLDSENGRIGSRALGPLWQIADQTTGLFIRLAELVMNPPPDKGDARHLGAGRSLLFAQKALVMALLHAVRFHFTEGAGETRRMLEWVAIGSHLFDHPRDYSIWEQAYRGGLGARDDPRNRAYRKLFNPGKVQEWLSRLDEELVKSYQRCNMMTHGTIISQARAVFHRDADPLPVIGVSYIDAEAGSVLPLIGETYEVLNPAKLGLGGLANRVLEPQAGEIWRQEFGEYVGRYQLVGQKWRELLGPELAAYRRERGDV